MVNITLPCTIFELVSSSIISTSSKPSREAIIRVIRYFTDETPNLSSRISKTFSLICKMERSSSFRSPSHASHHKIYDKYFNISQISI